MDIDLVSDLHIDHWSSVINNYPLGPVKNFPLKWKEGGDILVVAGDVSDNLRISLDYLDSLTIYYKHVLFVDGNHEHVYKYPKLIDHRIMDYQTKILENNKLVYLPRNDFIREDTVFIGYCGWWDYSVKFQFGYFYNWIEKLNNFDSETEFAKNVRKRALEEYKLLKIKIEKYELDDRIKNIIIVTHTLPNELFASDISTEFNSFLSEIDSSKLSHWLFGHTHVAFDKSEDGVRYVCNPRGRPEDFDRKEYKPLRIKLEK